MQSIDRKITEDNLLLTIAIFTRNQPQDCRRTLNSIVPQLRPGIEVVIGDNSTNIETKTLIQKEFNNPFVHYFNNDGDLGIDRNILSTTKKARGRYVWWFGDDEIRPGAIDHILDVIKKDPAPSLIWVNVISFQTSSSGLAVCNLGRDQFFKDGNQVLEEISDELTFISSIIFRKDEISNIDEGNMNRFIGSTFINLYLVMHILSQGGRFYYINYPYVIYNPTPVGKYYYDRFQVFGINFFEVVNNFKDKFYSESIKVMLAKNFDRLWKWVLVGWLGGYSTPKNKISSMFKLYWNFPEFWLAAPLFIMPKFVTKFAYSIYKKVFKRFPDRSI